jgi:AcrR family transcriptional regulator
MPEAVKPTRRYHSPRRRQQAAATRRVILEAAERLFARDGYGATSMAAVAREADVALKTIYVNFETKAGVLRALWNLRLRGDEEDIPVGRREWFQAVLAEPDPRRKLQLGGEGSLQVKLRVGPLFEVIRGGAAVDADVAALWERIQTEMHANLTRVIENLAEQKALRRRLDPGRASDIFWALNHPDTWQMLVVRRGWTPEEYIDWVVETSTQQLLRA